MKEASVEGKRRRNYRTPNKFIAARNGQTQEIKEAEQLSKGRKLELPAAQIGEAELEEIVKIGHAGESARAPAGEGSEASERL